MNLLGKIFSNPLIATGFVILINSAFVPAAIPSSPYLLEPGTVRYYDLDGAIQSVWIPVDFGIIGIEKVENDTVIDDNRYTRITWLREQHYHIGNHIEISSDTAYYRLVDSVLYQWTATGDSFVQDFSVQPGDSIPPSISSPLSDSVEHQSYPPALALYDTTLVFTLGDTFRVVWGDEVDPYDEDGQLPGKAAWYDSVLADTLGKVIVPSGSTATYRYWKPYYYIEGFGVTFSQYTYRGIALVGIQLPDSTLYGNRVYLNPTDTNESPPTSLLPQTPQLKQNYPNPFNPSTFVRYVLPEQSEVTLNIYNLDGELVKTLYTGILPAGSHQVMWDGTDQQHTPVASGLYFCRMQTKQNTQTIKMMLLR